MKTRHVFEKDLQSDCQKEVTLIGGKLIGGIELSKMQNVTLSCEKMRNGRDDIELQKMGKVTLICEKKVAKCRSL